MDFSTRLKGLRKAKRWSQADLVAVSGLSAPTISRYERISGDPAINWKNIQNLADALDVDERYLVGRRPDLDHLSFEAIAAQESLRRFLEVSSLRQREAVKYQRLVKDPAAPKSLQTWKDFAVLLKLFLGRNLPTNEKAGSARAAPLDKRSEPDTVRPFRRKG